MNRLVSAGRIRSIRQTAPEVAARLDAAWAATERLDAAHLDVLRSRVVLGLGLEPAPLDAGEDPVDRALATVADAFVRHVPDVPADAVGVLQERLGRPATRELIEALYVLDQAGRLRLAHLALFGHRDGGVDKPDTAFAATAGVPSSVFEANNELHHAILRLPGMDLETTELVRLSAGVHHRCRNCCSLRLVVDGRPVVDETVVQRLTEDRTTGDFPDATRAALRYAEAYMGEPSRIDEGIRAWLAAHFTRDQIVELTLNLSAWNWQKVLVALDLDRAADPERLSGVVINDDGTMSRVGPLPA